MAWYKSEIRLVSAKARAEVRNPKSETIAQVFTKGPPLCSAIFPYLPMPGG